MIGMDLLRLGLERGDSARQALEVMLELLETYGQSGNCGHRRRQFYDNSFLITDAREAFVLETFAHHYAVEQVRNVRTISNALSIGTQHCQRSAGLDSLARARGWYRGNGVLDFAASFADPAREAPGQGRLRCARSGEILAARNVRLRAADMMKVLRDHGSRDDGWRPDIGTARTICMHAHPAIGRRGQTTAAMVSELGDSGALHWVTAGAAPCTAIFRPVVLRHGLPDRLRPASDRFDPRSRWWRHERLHRAMLADYPARHEAIAAERDALERKMRRQMGEAMAETSPGAAAVQRQTIAQCWRMADETEARWLKQIAAMPVAQSATTTYRRAWSRLDRLARMPISSSGAVRRKGAQS
jgi:dipeptidase